MDGLLDLPISIKDFNVKILGPALQMLPRAMDTPQARVMVTAICLQESRLAHREQIGGPARGLAQFEKGGGVKGVMNHPLTMVMAKAVCADCGVPFDRTIVYQTLAKNDELAAAFARLLLWSDPKSLPGKNDAEGGWELYARTWRPGKPHRATWDDFYKAAVKYVYEEK